MPVAMSMTAPKQTDWLKSVLFDRGYLARIPGETIKVYLVMISACGGVPDRSVTISLRELTERTKLSCPTIVECLSRLELLGLVVFDDERSRAGEDVLRVGPADDVVGVR